MLSRLITICSRAPDVERSLEQERNSMAATKNTDEQARFIPHKLAKSAGFLSLFRQEIYKSN